MTVGGGSFNEAIANFSTVAGGRLNAARGFSSFAALKLRPVSYRYTETHRNAGRLGLIAQEVAEVVPDIVVSNAGVYGLQYDGLIPVLIAAIQDQQKTIEAQSARIDRLEQELNPR